LKNIQIFIDAVDGTYTIYWCCRRYIHYLLML